MSDPAPVPKRIERLGRGFTVDAAREGAFWERFASGAWEPETLALLAERTGPGVQFLDIGAWIGPTSLFAAAGGAEVVAVEADPVALVWLRRNLALNPELAARIRVFDKVLTPEGGVARFGTNRGRGGNSMSSTLHAEMATEWTLPAATPAELAAFAAPAAGSAARRFVKLDIEGGEYAVLPRLGPVLAGAEAVLVSWHPKVARAAGRSEAQLATDSAACLEALGAFRALTPQGEGWAPAPTDPVPAGDWLLLREGEG